MIEARYNDGADASVHAVQLAVAGGTLIVFGETARAEWPLGTIRIIDGGDGAADAGRPLRLGCAASPDARLTIADAEAIRTILAALPGSARQRLSAKRLAIVCAASAAGMALCVLLAFNFVPVVSGLIPVAAEERLGNNIRNQIVAMIETGSKGRATVCAHAAGTAILARLTERLLAGIDTPYTFRVEVVRVPMVNAVSLPGGRILFFNELFAKAESADEVAGVLAHEIAHNLERHAIKALVRQQGFAMAIGALTGYSGNSIASIGETLAALSFSRDAEREADQIAGELLIKAGLRTTGLASFFARIGKYDKDDETGARIAGYFSTHPPSAERAARAASYGSVGRPALSEAEFAVLKHMCD